ncbi:HNH endonuclease [Clostridium intestinale]|uniref:HNH endonuclease n=1 Tax=Clostridium intestinale TaxID=36845 RepID=UPI0028EC1173|nr:HNH endonuclease [Clostridium intestinale]
MKKKCSKQGCNKLVDYGVKYCIKHHEEFELQEKERYKEYSYKRRQDKEQKKYQAFYCSKVWIELAEYIRKKYSGMCVVCYLKESRIIDVEAVHHIKELNECWELRLNKENLISLCERCHRRVHVEYLKNIDKKKKMQDILFNLIEIWNKEFGE